MMMITCDDDYLCNVGNIVADAGDTFRVLEQFLPIKLPASVAACRLDPRPHAKVRRLPQVHHLLGVLGATFHVIRITGEQRPEVDNAPDPFTQLVRYALHHWHHLTLYGKINVKLLAIKNF